MMNTLDLEKQNTEEQNAIEQAYKKFVITDKHPCIMANAVFKLDNYKLNILDDMTSDAVVMPMLNAIENYLSNYDFESNDFETLFFCFKNNQFDTELEFEEALWDLLQKLHDQDDHDWDPEVSDDVESSKFSFSLKGKAFYIVGMHPKSSRLARRAPYCTVVFNLHW